jgi:hypothetical protein
MRALVNYRCVESLAPPQHAHEPQRPLSPCSVFLLWWARIRDYFVIVFRRSLWAVAEADAPIAIQERGATQCAVKKKDRYLP